jgi:hypothetical protein
VPEGYDSVFKLNILSPGFFPTQLALKQPKVDGVYTIEAAASAPPQGNNTLLNDQWINVPNGDIIKRDLAKRDEIVPFGTTDDFLYFDGIKAFWLIVPDAHNTSWSVGYWDFTGVPKNPWGDSSDVEGQWANLYTGEMQIYKESSEENRAVLCPVTTATNTSRLIMLEKERCDSYKYPWTDPYAGE